MPLILGSCTRAVTLVLEAGTQEAWGSLVSRHPLPRGYRVVEEVRPPARAAGRLRLTVRAWSEAAPSDPAKALAVRTLAASVPLLSPLDDIPRSALGAVGSPALRPIEEVGLPERLISVDGIFPDAASYPLREETLLTLSSTDPRLRAWFDAIPPSTPSSPALCWVAAVGDIMLDRGVDRILLGQGGAEAVFGSTLPVLRSAQVVIGNLESAVTNRTSRASKGYTFKASPEALPVLARAGFTYLTVVNNHSFDYGLDGFVDTLELLRGAGIGTSGAGMTIAQAELPYTARCAGAELRIWSLGAYPVESSGFDGRSTRATAERPGVLWADPEVLERLAAQIEELPGQAESGTVVVVHGGQEWQTSPGASQRELYQRLASAGVDLVLGSHPHVLQGIEAYGDGLIVYSLGNFVFPGMQGVAGATESAIVLVGFLSGRVVALRIVPVTLAGGTVRLASGSATRERVLALSRQLAASP